jgi:hypothetical protein
MERFEMWCWKRMDGIIWTGFVRNAEVLQKVRGDRNVLQKARKNLNLLVKPCMGTAF